MITLDKGTYLGNIVNTAQTDGFIIGITSYCNDSCFQQMHYHENPHISFVLNGGNVEKRRNSEIERIPGKVTFYRSGEAHQNIHKQFPASHINIEITQDFLQQNLITEEEIGWIIEHNTDIKFSILQIYREQLIDDQQSDASIQLSLLSLVSRQNNSGNKKPGWIHILDQLLHDRWRETITLEELSLAAGVHPITISKHFSRYFSCTLGEYNRKLKTEKAIELIKTSKNSLTDIAYQCGFSDQSHFSRTFKEITGLLPRQYQKL